MKVSIIVPIYNVEQYIAKSIISAMQEGVVEIIIVEDKSTCAVFGMPAAAIELGAAKEVLPRTEIAKRILEMVNK